VADAADAVLEASVAGSFSRIGIDVRSRLLPEFTHDARPPTAGRVAVVTGATSGLGRATASDLARRGWRVHFLARDAGRARDAQREISRAGRGEEVSFGLADMEDLDSVRAFARSFLQAHGRLDALIQSAGATYPTFGVNQAGIERTVAGQVVAPFALTQMLLPALRAAAPSRVITVSSGGMYTQRLELSALEMPPPDYRGVTEYARVKRAQVVLNREWARRTEPAQVAFHAMHPGWAATPGITASLPGFSRVMRPLLRSAGQGADTIVWLATADAGLLGSGRFWHDRRPRPEYLLPWTREPSGAAGRLWDWVAQAARC
jgi:NAD(P)-dependent dehydrogenase (short-subunit alcohol dehydrogenase family)